MHLPRTILLGLGPLLSLWAVGAQMASQPADRLRQHAAEQRLTADALQHFMQPMVSFLLLAAEQRPPRAMHASHASFGFEALASTSFSSSVWLVRDEPALLFHARRHQSPRLRC